MEKCLYKIQESADNSDDNWDYRRVISINSCSTILKLYDYL